MRISNKVMKGLLLFLLMLCIGVYPPAALSQTPSVQNGQAREAARLIGRVLWPGQDVSHANISVYRDARLTHPYLSGIPQRRDGHFSLSVEPGRYYLAAYVDVDKSGRFGAGDGFGVYGITEWTATSQDYQVVEVREGQKVHGINIPITARAQLKDGAIKIVPVSEYQASELHQFQAELHKVTSGCRGRLILGETADAKVDLSERQALILAYTDLSWKYRVGIAQVHSSGEWALNLPPGKYYLMAIMDNNGTNTLDAGDDFGFYGVEDMRTRGKLPQPVLVAANKFTEKLTIAITATYDAVRRNERYQTMLEQSSTPIDVTGTVSPQQTAPAWVHAYADADFITPLASAETDENSTFRFKLPPGDYYLIATLDADGDGKYSEGDGLGGYGTVDITSQQPTTLVLAEDESERSVDILISARYDTKGQLYPAMPGIETDIEQGRIAGRVIFDGKPPVPARDSSQVQGVLSIAYTPDFQSPVPMPMTLTDAGTYHVNVLPGSYYVMAVIDRNGDGNIGIADGVGLYGTRFPVRGEPTLITVYPGRTTSHIDIEIFATYIDENGTMAEIEDGGRWEIRRRYGEPEDVFNYTRNGLQIEEWKYWTKGIGIRWEADGAGWNFVEGEEFSPSAAAQKQAPSAQASATEMPTGFPLDERLSERHLIYFAYDNVVWHLSAAAGLVALGAGTHPTVARDGTLLYQDLEGSIVLHDNAVPKGRIVLPAQAMARDAALSPDADYVAAIRTEYGTRTRVVILHLPSREEFVVPSTAQHSFMPAWNADGTLLAYVTEGTIENSATDTPRNIYAFDRMRNSVEPIVVSPHADAEPTWSSSNPNQLAFTRTVDSEVTQIWLVTYADTGIPTELQLTRHGGSHPVWIPPEGRWLLYENNGQLWTIDTLSPETSEMPLMHNGQVIFGHQPAVAVLTQSVQ